MDQFGCPKNNASDEEQQWQSAEAEEGEEEEEGTRSPRRFSRPGYNSGEAPSTPTKSEIPLVTPQTPPSVPLELYHDIKIIPSAPSSPYGSEYGNNETEVELSSSSSSSIKFINHYSSNAVSSSAIRFRNKKLYLYGENASNQFVVENEYNNNKKEHEITVKHVRTSSFGLNILRSCYTLVALLVFGFLFVFCFQVVLFLFFNLFAHDLGLSTFVIGTLATLASIPIFIFGNASIMVLGWLFVKETWNGHKLLMSMSSISSTIIEWISFIIFLGIPSLTISITLFLGLGNWWEISALVWVWCVFSYMVVFAICIVTTEIITYFRVIRIHFNPNNDNDIQEQQSKWKTFWKLLLKAIYLKQRFTYSGYRHEKYLIKDDDTTNNINNDNKSHNSGSYIFNDNYKPINVRTTWYTKFTALNFNQRFYDTLETPVRAYTLDEMLDINTTAIITKRNWSLDSMFCSNKSKGSKIVSGSKHGLSLGQIRSSIICQLLGSVLMLLLIIALLTWMRYAKASIIILILLLSIFICFWPIAKSIIPLFNSLKPITTADNNDDSEDERFHQGKKIYLTENDEYNDENDEDVHASTFQVWESIRITQPRTELLYTTFIITFLFFFLFPLISLFITNGPIGYVFLFWGTFSFLRLTFNVRYLLVDLGSISNVDVHLSNEKKIFRESVLLPSAVQNLFKNYKDKKEVEEYQVTNEKLRLANIMQHTRGDFVNIWIYGYGIAFLLIILFIIVVLFSGDFGSTYKVKGATYVNGFSYPRRYRNNSINNDVVGDLKYQTCTLTKGFGFPNNSSLLETPIQLQDFAFMATSAYMGPDEAQPALNKYFGEGKVVDEYKFVENYRKKNGSQGGVSYKLFSFVDYPGYAVMSIRGSEALMDWLVNLELWSCALLAQTVRFVMPLGYLWTPIYYKLVKLANSVQGVHVRENSYYRDTFQFVKDIQNGWDKNPFTTLRITGHSLGGGTAIITGAQTGVSTVAISAPNAMLSRQTFDPPITVEQLNSRVLNVIPDRDLVAKIDDPGDLYQRIECRAPAHSLFGCHSISRSFCEYAYQCGSNGRPVLCECVSKFGYPIPDQLGSTEWEEACKDA